MLILREFWSCATDVLQFISKQLLLPTLVCFSSSPFYYYFFLNKIPPEAFSSHPWQYFLSKGPHIPCHDILLTSTCYYRQVTDLAGCCSVSLK